MNAQKQSLTALEQFKARYWPRYAEPMARCEERLVEISRQTGASLGEACEVTLSAGGKRLRPLLVFLSSARSTPPGSRQSAAAVAVELVHTATLIHDDILDNARLRRGKPTMFASYGGELSRSAGDYLFSQAFLELTATGSGEAVALLARTSLDLSLGELLQMEQEGDFNLTHAAYEERCRLKTAGLFDASCRLGAMLSGCSAQTVAAMGRFGQCLGLAFQISDDILDYAGEAAATGKLTGTDLRDGTMTLPLILALRLDPALRELFAGKLDDDRVDRIIERVVRSGGLEQSRDKALEYVAEAEAILEAVSDELDAEPLGLIAGMTVERNA